ncbi:MAG: cobyric acid synthase [Nitrosopumilus sp.]
MNSIMIQGTSSGAGKSTLVTCICRILSNRGFKVAPFKSQNMSNFAYVEKNFQISRAQAIQAIGARCQITPELNPIMLKPLGNYFSSVYVNGKFFKKMHAKDYYSKFVNHDGIKIVKNSLSKLRKQYDFLIIEGAGSPAEINLKRFDIANMKIAEITNSSVILVTDIDKGGSFASIVGTMNLLDMKHQKLVKGFIFNKFRGDIQVLKPGFSKIKKITKVPVLGTIPMLKIDLPEEDSLNVNAKQFKWSKHNLEKVDSEINRLSKIIEKSINLKSIERMII